MIPTLIPRTDGSLRHPRIHCDRVDAAAPIGLIPFTNSPQTASFDSSAGTAEESCSSCAAPQLLLLHKRKTAALNYSLSKPADAMWALLGIRFLVHD